MKRNSRKKLKNIHLKNNSKGKNKKEIKKVKSVNAVKKDLMSKLKTSYGQENTLNAHMFFVKQEKKTNKIKNIIILIILIAIGIFVSYLGYSNNIYRYDLISEKGMPKDNFILVFYQPSCPHCVSELPIFYKLKYDYNYTIKAINIIEQPKFIKEFNLKATPTIILFFNNSSLRVEGEISLDQILKLINELKSGKVKRDNHLFNLINHDLNSKDSCNIGNSCG